MTIVVVDASVAVKWFLPEADSEIADRLLASDCTIHAPNLMLIEVSNAFWKHALNKTVDRSLWNAARPRLQRSIDQWHEDGPLLAEAWDMACDAAHPIYDGIYLALARRLNAVCVSVDKQFLNIAPKGLAVSLADWAPRTRS